MIADIQTGQPSGDLVRSLPIKALPTSANGWPPHPFQIVSLYQVLKFDAKPFVRAMEGLQYCITWSDCHKAEEPSQYLESIKWFLEQAKEQCSVLGFDVS